MPALAHPHAEPTTPSDTLHVGEELVRVRAGAWRLLVPLRHVERVLQAAMPAARPGASIAAPVVALGDALVPVVFAGALVGATEVRIAPDQQMVLLASGGHRALLWVDAVEEVVPHGPVPGPGGDGPAELILAWSGPERPLAVLDVPRLLALAA